MARPMHSENSGPLERILHHGLSSIVSKQTQLFSSTLTVLSFFDEVKRIASPDYLPQEADVLRAEVKTTGICETRLAMGSLRINLFDLGEQRPERRKWIPSFENIPSIIFVVNLACYDQVLEEWPQNRMVESLMFFDSVVNSPWFIRTSVILLLANIGLFRSKLALSPLANYFPDYIGGNDVNKAAKYILSRFNQVNRAHLNLYPHLVEVTDKANLRVAFATIKEILLQSILRDSGTL